MWHIRSVTIENRIVLAPMAGVTDIPFRLLCKEYGCALVYGPLVSAKAINFGSRKTKELLAFAEAERPISLQLFGSEPESMAAAASYVETLRPDLIDINMGCPTPKIVQNDDGSALLRDPVKAGEVVAAVVDAVSTPVTVKIRKGWDEGSITAVEVARLAERAGAAAVAVHGRTREQFYSGKADWSIIQAVKESVSVPVIGNGDVVTPQDAQRMLEITGCDAVMIGRAALGNPWLFGQVVKFLETGEMLPGPSDAEKVAMAERHLAMALEQKGDHALFEMRKHLAWYLKGIPDSHRLKQTIMQTESSAQVKELLQGFRDQI